jgi:methylenetetrahydrofolate dehydrogenase (NADP+)/methenyltetrahydrofolate cyclohydrolase
MIVSGKELALSIKNELRLQIKESNEKFVMHIFIVGDNPVIEKFVQKKREFAESLSVEFIEHRFKDAVSENELINSINSVANECGTSKMSLHCGMVIQLPLPEHIDTTKVLNQVPPIFDIDGLAENSLFYPPVAGAIYEIIKRHNIDVEGKRVLIVGKGILVGKPVAKLMLQLGAEVAIADKTTGADTLKEMAMESDIIITGAGVPNLIKPDMVKTGVVLLDAGTSTQSGNVVGDIDHACEHKARLFARTPGGVGPMTIAVLFKNLVIGSGESGMAKLN